MLIVERPGAVRIRYDPAGTHRALILAKEPEVLAASRAFAADVQRLAQLRSGIPLRILGPAPMNIAMVNNHYRYKLTLKCRNDNAFRALMGEALAAYNAAGWPGKVSVYLDFHSDADI